MSPEEKYASKQLDQKTTHNDSIINAAELFFAPQPIPR